MIRALLITLSLLADPIAAQTWSFGLLGDTPYSDKERREFPHLLAQMGRSGLDFIVHAGDFKNGNSPCDDALFKDRLALFSESEVPFVLAPGDNEWTDCHRLTAGGYDPVERLSKLRDIFWAEPRSLGKNTLPLTQQNSPYREQAHFVRSPALFATFNLPGSLNNWGLTNQPGHEFQERNPWVLKWLRQSFALARQQDQKGIVLIFQANPGFEDFSRGFGHQGYREFLEALREETLAFPGQVLVLHGDTHWHRIDQPLRDRQGKTIANFRRVESYGYPTLGWAGSGSP